MLQSYFLPFLNEYKNPISSLYSVYPSHMTIPSEITDTLTSLTSPDTLGGCLVLAILRHAIR